MKNLSSQTSLTGLVKMLIKELASTGPLSGDGYFDVGRGTLTSMVSTTITYLIILMQFRAY